MSKIREHEATLVEGLAAGVSIGKLSRRLDVSQGALRRYIGRHLPQYATPAMLAAVAVAPRPKLSKDELRARATERQRRLRARKRAAR